ncbi:glutathione S-transferase [Amylibacter marinus]|uniref:Glutathione S-transferase n=1 Tax=Amylibacter marinus TaxID=1475483 RepID=A0ABQ5VV37_9RHOB|nr:glutathione S-transferase [Amylibacter marinus]GLQ35307.1 glutathione S-transferase [Amylibacter marinus]
MTQTLPVLYSFRRCPYAMRARIALSQMGHRVALREVIFRDKPAELLETSPKGTVPVMVLPDGQVIDESFDIMCWAYRDRPVTEAERTLVQRCDLEFKPWLDRYKYPDRFKDTSRDQALDKACIFIAELDQLLGATPYLSGDQRGFADIGIAPFIRQFAHVDRPWFMAQPFGRVIAWYQDFVEWYGYNVIMDKYPKWQKGDGVTEMPIAEDIPHVSSPQLSQTDQG